MTQTTRFIKSLVRRLAGAGSPAREDAGDVFRAFADGVERRVSSAAETGPKIRLPASDSAVGAWR